jgi:hypothetical protein
MRYPRKRTVLSLTSSEPHREALESLALQGLKEQWAVSSVEWSQAVVLPSGVRPRAYIDMVSQLYHVEEVSIDVLGRMLDETSDNGIRRYLHTQIADETRHAETYRLYLQRLGDMAPINEGLRILLDMGLGVERSFRSKIIALNVMMETDALTQQSSQIDALPCPLLRDINRLVSRDEARHASFGALYMKWALADVSESDKQAIVRFGASLWRLWETAQLERYGKTEAALFGTRAVDFQTRWSAVRRRFTDIGLLSGSAIGPGPVATRVVRHINVAHA